MATVYERFMMELELDDIVGRGQVVASAVRAARSGGATWESIGELLHMTAAAAQRRYAAIDRELGLDDKADAREHVFEEDGTASVEPEVSPTVFPGPEKQINGPEDLDEFTDDQLVEMAKPLQGDLRYRRTAAGDIKTRESIVIALYQRDVPQIEIAKIFGLTHQRINQIVKVYFDRMEKVWKRERLARGQ